MFHISFFLLISVQEYGTAAGKGHADDPADWAHTEHAATNEIQFERVRASLLCWNLLEGSPLRRGCLVLCPSAYLTIRIYLMEPAQMHRYRQALTHTAMKAHAPEAPHTVIKPCTRQHMRARRHATFCTTRPWCHFSCLRSQGDGAHSHSGTSGILMHWTGRIIACHHSLMHIDESQGRRRTKCMITWRKKCNKIRLLIGLQHRWGKTSRVCLYIALRTSHSWVAVNYNSYRGTLVQ